MLLPYLYCYIFVYCFDFTQKTNNKFYFKMHLNLRIFCDILILQCDLQVTLFLLFLLFVNYTKKRYFMYLFFYYYGASDINNSSYYPSVLLCIKTFIHFVKLAFVLSKCVHVEKILDAISFQYHNLLS